MWQDLLAQECYDALISEAGSVLPGENYFAEAQLYIGFAQLAEGAAPTDSVLYLHFAEQNLPELTTVDPSRELLLLYRGQMIIYGRLADDYDRDDLRAKAEDYLAKAVSVAPPSEVELIRTEFYQRAYDSDIRP